MTDQDLWPPVLTELVASRALDGAQASAAMTRDDAGRRDRGPDRRVPARLFAPRARPSRRWRRSRGHDARVRGAGPRAGSRSIDTCGTGGDRAGTFNISTVAALVVAGAGVPVAKHGNRAATSHCGSADLLEELGVNIDLDAEGVERCLDEAGIAFMFAPDFHPAMAHAAPVRGELRVPTVVQLPRAAHEPGAALRAGGRGRRRADASADGRGPRPARHAGAAVPRRRRARRAHHHRPVDRVRREGRDGARDASRPGEVRARQGQARGARGRRRPEYNADIARADHRRRAGRRAATSCS